MSGRGQVRVSLGDDGLGGVVHQRVNQRVRVAGTIATGLALVAQIQLINCDSFLLAARLAMLTRACCRTFAPDGSSCRLSATHAVVNWSS